MPRFDGTGPMGFGPRSGGGFGYCPPSAGAGPVYGGGGYSDYGVGRGGYPRGGGRGRAWGGGRGQGYGYPAYPGYPPPPPAWGPPPGEEIDFLRSQEQGLREELDAIRSRIEQLEKEPKPAEE